MVLMPNFKTLVFLSLQFSSIYTLSLFSLPAHAQISTDVCDDFLESQETLDECKRFCTIYPYNSRCYPVFDGKYDRKIVSERSYPWSAIGTVKNIDGGHCTGTLVAPNIVLTAAHCLYIKAWRGGWHEYKPNELTYYAGPSESTDSVKSSIADILVAPGFNPGQNKDDDTAVPDYAFLRLNKELGLEFGTINVHSIKEGELSYIVNKSIPVIQAGYGGKEAEKLSVHIDCFVDRFSNKNEVAHKCDTLWGDSGSPLLLHHEDTYEVLAVDSRFSMDEDRADIVNVAVDARAFYETYLELSGRSVAPSEEAIDAYRFALKVDPDNASNHNNLGAALRAQDKLDDAIAAYRKALEIDPDFAVAHYNLGIALKAQNKFGEAIAAFQRTLELDPDFTGAQENLTEVQRLFDSNESPSSRNSLDE